MGNILLDNSNALTPINYEVILKFINENIEKIKITEKDEKISFNNLDEVINEIITEIISYKKRLSEILEINKDKKPHYISIVHKDEDKFRKNILNIHNTIKEKHIKTLRENYKIPMLDLYQYKENYINKKYNFGLDYDFSNKNLKRKRVSFNKSNELKSERLRIDEVNISFLIREVDEAIKKNLTTLLIDKISDEDLLEERKLDISEGKRGVSEVINKINDDSLARIKRTISYLYLEYLIQHCKTEYCGLKYLKIYIKRFYMLERYLQDLINNRPNDDSKIHLEDKELNIANLLCNGNAFDSLPIIGIVNGILSEHRNIEKKQFKIALKLKLNGSVKKEDSKSSCQYWLDYMTDNLKSENPKIRMKFISYFLYTFMFREMDNKQYDPIAAWENEKSNINSTFNDKVRNFKNYFYKEKIEEKINEMKKVLKIIIKYKSSSLNVKNYTKILSIDKGIIDNLEGTNFFKEFNYENNILQFVSIVEKVDDPKNVLLSIPIDITIKSTGLYENLQNEETNLVYDIKGYKVLPIIFYPINISKSNDDRRKYLNKLKIKDHFKELKGNFISFPYTVEENMFFKNDGKRYLFQFIYTNLVYMIIYTLLKMQNINNKKDLFIPILRFHFQDSENKNAKYSEFIRSFSKSLEHMLSIDYRSSSQGFDINKKDYINNVYKNAISSLYSKIPKIFEERKEFQIKKFAIVIVTSSKSDSVSSNSNFKSTIIGEVILFDVLEDGKIKCDPWGTFGDNYDSSEIYNHPIILSDLVSDLYKKNYEHILYISKAPYSTKLNITGEKDNLYFMSESVLKSMQNEKEKLMIYPLYYEHFYAIDNHSSNNTALYIKDTRELDENLTKLDKATAGVFNLYSGKSVSGDLENKNYNSVILYSTILNKYEDNIFNGKLYNALINNDKLKDDFISFITFFHYSRYETDKDITVKINPYEKLIGDDGVASNCVYKFNFQGNFKIKHNSLALLLEIKDIVDRR